jgi:DNA-directed RNA polymerase subunit RPC12/RpoP
VGSRCDCTWILGLARLWVVTTDSDDEAVDSRLTIRIERRGVRRMPCSGCGRRTSRVRSAPDRTWDDVPWASHPVTLIHAQRRVRCRRCGSRTEAIAFADPKARVTRRLRQLIGVDCQSTLVAASREGRPQSERPPPRARAGRRVHSGWTPRSARSAGAPLSLRVAAATRAGPAARRCRGDDVAHAAAPLGGRNDAPALRSAGAARRVDATAAGQPDSLLYGLLAPRAAWRAALVPGASHGVDASHKEGCRPRRLVPVPRQSFPFGIPAYLAIIGCGQGPYPRCREGEG